MRFSAKSCFTPPHPPLIEQRPAPLELNPLPVKNQGRGNQTGYEVAAYISTNEEIFGSIIRHKNIINHFNAVLGCGAPGKDKEVVWVFFDVREPARVIAQGLLTLGTVN